MGKRKTPLVHEDFHRQETVKHAPERSFGLMWAAIALGVAAYQGWHGNGEVAAVCIGIALVCVLLAFKFPALLGPLNRGWTYLGIGMGKVINPVIMLLLFVITIVPAGLIMRVIGRDPLRRRFDPNAPTYWIPRQPPGPERDSMPRQF